VAVDQISAIDLHPLTDNFILLWTRPADVDWFDDGGWSSIVEHWEIAAWVARQAGFKGIVFDPEPPPPSSGHNGYWNYWFQRRHDRFTFDEYYAKARQRGREVMQSIVGQYPDITLFCYRMNSTNMMAVNQTNPHLALYALEPKHGYGLYSGFIDGWLDVIPPGST
jgi:hypothetical protein